MHTRGQIPISLSNEDKKILLKYFPKGICAFDLEMTGLSPLFDQIIEIAALKLDPTGELRSFHELINPLIPIPERTKKFHGLDNEDLRDKRTIKKPLQELVEFYENTPLLGHNSLFDASFIIRNLHQFNLPISLSSVYDTCKFGRLLYKKSKEGPENFKLSTLAEYFGLSFTHHQAMEDAAVTLQIMARLLSQFEKDGTKNLKDISFLFKLNSFKKGPSYILPSKLKEIRPFVQNQQEIEIMYKGGTKPNTYRQIKPLSILPMPNGLILYALCISSDQNKYFSVKKIQSFRVPE